MTDFVSLTDLHFGQFCRGSLSLFRSASAGSAQGLGAGMIGGSLAHMFHGWCWRPVRPWVGLTPPYLLVASLCGLDSPTLWGLGFKDKDNVLLLCEKEMPASTLSLMLRPSELDHQNTEGEDCLETGHSEPKTPEFIH